jgi:hypothetical protein
MSTETPEVLTSLNTIIVNTGDAVTLLTVMLTTMAFALVMIIAYAVVRLISAGIK